MYAEILELFGGFDAYLPSCSACVVRGVGRHFCAGNDLDEFLTLTPENSPERMQLVRAAFSALYHCPVPTVAAVHGSALGTGLVIASCCDVVICDDTARFGVPEVGVGVMGAARHLSRLVPQQVMRRMYLTADPVDGRELERFGGVSAVVAASALDEAAITMASRIARHSPVALRTAKESLNAIEPMPLEPAYELEQSLTASLAGSADSLEARRSIVEKRAPIWKGR